MAVLQAQFTCVTCMHRTHCLHETQNASLKKGLIARSSRYLMREAIDLMEAVAPVTQRIVHTLTNGVTAAFDEQPCDHRLPADPATSMETASVG